jgi:hypothetical protein
MTEIKRIGFGHRVVIGYSSRANTRPLNSLSDLGVISVVDRITLKSCQDSPNPKIDFFSTQKLTIAYLQSPARKNYTRDQYMWGKIIAQKNQVFMSYILQNSKNKIQTYSY